MAEKHIAIITTYNEAETIGDLINDLIAAGIDDVHLVDGGSADETVDIAEQRGAMIIAMSERTPIARCLRIGWGTALASGADRILQIDAGGSHQVRDIFDLFACKADLVIGSRFVKGSRYKGNPKRQMMSRIAGMACNVALPGACWHDWTSGYRVFSRECAEYLVDQEYRAGFHGWQIEVLAHAARAGFRIEEVPITYIAGRSSFNRTVAKEAIGVWWRLMKQRENPASWAKPSSFGGIL